MIAMYNFKYCSPRKGRLRARADPALLSTISIHTPRKGSDYPHPQRRPVHPISVHAPRVGSDSAQPLDRYRASLFQSTLPVWGATTAGDNHMEKSRNFNPRSPCGERRSHGQLLVPFAYFNPRSPCGERRSPAAGAGPGRGFQSTLPVWGATGLVPRELTAPGYFNPRSPCGERRSWSSSSRPGHFNPRSPCGERRFGGDRAVDSEISIHAPRVGSDIAGGLLTVVQVDFNPRSPCGERQCHHRGRPAGLDFNPRSPCGERLAPASDPASSISIHAPRVGSDVPGSSAQIAPRISIHAPRVGSDSKTAQILLEILSHLNSFAPSEKKKIPFHRKEQGKFIEIF